MRIVIPGKYPSLNEYIRACRADKQAGNRLKKRCEQRLIDEIAVQTYGKPKITRPVTLHYTFFEDSMRRDMDNIFSCFAKFFQDALVKAFVLDGDGWAHIRGFSAQFCVDKIRPRIEIDIEEVAP